MASAIATASRGGKVASSAPPTTSTGVRMADNNARWSGRRGTTLFTAHETRGDVDQRHRRPHVRHNVGALPQRRRPRNALSTDRISGGPISPRHCATRSNIANSIFCRSPARPAVQFISTARPTRSGIRRGKGPADHAAPRIADEVRLFDAEAVEDVGNAARALGEGEHPRQGLTAALARRVDQHHLVAVDEFSGHPVPHVAGHQEAGPEQDRRSRSPDLQPDSAERGVHRLVAELVADAGHRRSPYGRQLAAQLAYPRDPQRDLR